MPISKSRPQTNLLYAFAFVGVVMAVFTLGYRVAGWSWGDALYMVVITAFSVGFGEVVPITEPWLRVWTMALIVLGCTGIIFVTGTLVQWLTEAQIQLALGGKRMEHEIEKLKNHAIICGFGRIGRMIASQLQAGGIPFVIVDQAPDRVAEVREAGWLTLQGETTDESVLRAAGIARARVLATVLPNDAANVFITLSARNMNPAVQIIARGEVPSTERKLLQAGANRVVLPAHIGADRIAHLILHPNARDILGGKTKSSVDFEHHLTELGLDMEEIEIGPDSPWLHKRISEVETDAAGRLMAVAIMRKEGGTDLNPGPTAMLMPGDALVVLKRVMRK
ncbi:MAG: NAD-binding protein [Prosthecobacter sp.]|jgi:voltage-gated potassium channel|uniref:potassium channel family protein n=1 Tax=Prosthecobacter sp. TaxID=1965333 RepID=UPI0019DC2400|nr:potassium channel protein [Prosthecobacter sp.]MBE2282081.1 NAD-binding protein [Prosthecobacter sp.]